ncbi:hypothetical protein Syun_021050 [Stephania yunnanensis]|uniref:Uncharacterized protein n=1 Tax=Stephania yunnanensis TaxID=152371 RepID=A0AAP0IF35_9MAGN
MKSLAQRCEMFIWDCASMVIKFLVFFWEAILVMTGHINSIQPSTFHMHEKELMFLTLIFSGPSHPGQQIDVFQKPLVK